MMMLDTVRVFLDEDTRVEHTTRLAMPYKDICGPIEDVGYLWPQHHHVTAIQDEFGQTYHVLEPFAKILDNWLLALEQEAHKPISFSQQ